MAEYMVVWVIDIDADDPQEAAERARDTMMGQVCYDGTPPQFYVAEYTGISPRVASFDNMVSVDLADVG